MAKPRRHALPPNPYEGLPFSEAKRRILAANKPRPGAGASLEELAEWLRYRIDDLVFSAHQSRLHQTLARLTASGPKHDSDLDGLIDELASIEAQLAHREEATLAAEQVARRAAEIELRRRQWQRERLTVLCERLGASPEAHRVSARAIRDAVAEAGPPEGIPEVPLPPGEEAIIALSARLYVVRDVGYALSAGMSGSQHGSFSSASTSLGVRSRHWSFADGLTSGSSYGSFDGRLEGTLDRREAQVELDRGILVVTASRLLFVGGRESHAVPLRDVLGLGLDGDRLAPRATAFARGEAFGVEDADLAGPVIAALVMGAMQTLPDTPGARSASAAVGGRRERECPWCAEPILTRAKVCKHCGRDVDPIE